MNNPQSITSPSSSKKQSFDQWLLSDRNIKLALYAGGSLMVLAGLIFAVANWSRIPDVFKFGITATITAAAYMGGYLLFKKQAYQMASKAMLGVGSGFMALNFFILQIYDLVPADFPDKTIWLVGAVWCCFIYSVTAYLTRDGFFTYLGIFAAANVLTAALVMTNAAFAAYPLAFAGLMLALLLLAWLVEKTTIARFTRFPFNLTAHTGTPILMALAFGIWLVELVFASFLSGNQTWLALSALSIGVLFYLCLDLLHKKVIGRWLWALAGPFVFFMALGELDASDDTVGAIFMASSFAYLGFVFVLRQRQEKPISIWPLTLAAYLIATLVTLFALARPDDLALILLGDVLLLVLSAIIFQDDGLLYGATWLFIWPAYLYLSQLVPYPVSQGVGLGILGIMYMAAAYLLKDRTPERPWQWSGPLLSAASFLSILVPVMVWQDALVATITLMVIGGLYLLTAIWLKQSGLALPTVLAFNLATLAFWHWIFGPFSSAAEAHTLAHFLIGLQWIGAGYALRYLNQKEWASTFYLVSALIVISVYLEGIFWGGGMALTLSVGLSLFLLGLAWLERKTLATLKLPGMLTYLAAGVIFIGQFYFLSLLGLDGKTSWPVSAALLCGLFFLVGWVLNVEPVEQIYGRPLRELGLVFTLIPFAGSLISSEAWLVALVCGLVAPTVIADALMRRNAWQVYLGVWVWVVGLWSLALAWDITEPQAFILLPGVVLLGMAITEKRRGHDDAYWLLALLGLTVLMGSALLQSFDGVEYAFLLAAECLMALGWGIWARSRIMVQAGVSMLLVNCGVQFWPAFVELPSWIKIGSSGTILFGLGMLALFWREEILSTQRNLVDEWRQWQR